MPAIPTSPSARSMATSWWGGGGGGPCGVVDLRTAVTSDVVSADAEYLGGIICPGIGISTAALFSRTARLPKVDFREPERLVGTNTVGSIQSGLYYGYAGMIDGIL